MRKTNGDYWPVLAFATGFAVYMLILWLSGYR
jgi:hypothetical protein